MIDYKARKFLVELGKVLPFIVCSIVALCYSETILSLATQNYLVFDNGNIALDTPISFAIGEYFKYDWMLVLVLTVLSVAIRTCIWNKICVAYLALQILERQYFTTTELYKEEIFLIATVNIIVCGIIIIKGVTK